MIRAAALDDIPALLEMGRRFAAAAHLADLSGYDDESARLTFEYLVTDPQGILLVMDGGAAGAVIHPVLFNRSHLTASELFWWVDPESRGGGLRLFRALETEAEARGAHSIQMTTITGLGDGPLAHLYQRRGYRATDRNYLKVFGD